MKKDVSVYIQDILESIDRIEDYTGSIDEDEFNENIQVQDAVLRRLEIIGEAVKNIDNNFRNENSQIPWKQIAGMRDILIHQYFGVNLKRVWLVLKRDIPELKTKLNSLEY